MDGMRRRHARIRRALLVLALLAACREAPPPPPDGTYAVDGYNVDPSGTFDSTAAIRAAMRFRTGMGGGVVMFGPGLYQVTPPMWIFDDAESPLTIIGSGAYETTFTFGFRCVVEEWDTCG